MYIISNTDEDKIIYSIAFGDSLGLPYENLKEKTIKKDNFWYQEINLFHNMTSDDTDHALFTLHALKESKNSEEFKKKLKHYYKKWCYTFPLSIGKASLKAFFLGRGVNSAGNGGIMRAPVIGCYFRNNKEQIFPYIKISTEMTHRNQLAILTSYCVAMLIAYFSSKQISWSDKNIKSEILSILNECIHQYPLTMENYKLWEKFILKFEKEDFDTMFPSEISGFCLNTLFASLSCCLKNDGNVLLSMKDIILKGGDTDTNAMLIGALCYDQFDGQNLNIKIIDYKFLRKNLFDLIMRNIYYFKILFQRIYLRIKL